MIGISRTRFDTPCRIEIEHSHDHFHAHVELEDGIAINPGDKVRVHGDPIIVGFGESARFERMATVERATPLERLWTKFIGHFEMTELYEVSFTPRRTV
jgi:hypothetical protein